MSKRNIKIGASFSSGALARVHTLRIGRVPENVTKELIKDNVVLIDNLHGRTIEQFTNDEMQPHIDAYNKKQKQKCRRIKEPYTEWHKENGQLMQHVKDKDDVKFAYETVICYGNHEDMWHEYFNPDTSMERKQEMHGEAVKYYKEAVDEFMEKYPHLKVLYAVIHADEANGSIHCHLCFQPQAEYDKGLARKVCIGRALSQDGIARLDERKDANLEGYQLTRLYKEFRHQVLNRKLEELGYEIMEETHGREHIPSNVYTEKMQEIDRREQELQKQERFVEELEQVEEIERRPNYDPKTVKTIQYKERPLSKAEEMVIMPPDTFDALRISIDAQNLNRKTEEKAKRQNEIIAKTMESIRTGSDIELIKENNRLKEEIQQKEYTNRSLQIELKKQMQKVFKLESILDTIKNFVRMQGLESKLAQWLRRFQEPEIERSR